jgi:opacity protein-like surface antigen
MFNNKQQNKKNVRPYVMGLLMLFTTSMCVASIDVMDEDQEGYFGEATVPTFRNAVDGTDEINARDRAFLEGVEETRTAQRWYARFLIGRAKVRLSEVVNQSSGIASSVAINTPSATNTLFEYFLAGGYMWEHWAAEMELFIAKPFNYNPNSTFGGVSTDSTAKVRQFALFINLQYILPRWFDFYPRRLQLHIDAGIGGALKITDIDSTPIMSGQETSTSTRLFNVVGNLGLGARYQLTPSFLIDIVYRYLDVGKTSFGPIVVTADGGEAVFESQNLRSNGFFVGLTYQI